MNGIQIYLKEDVPFAQGHNILVDSPWALTSISQAQFWNPSACPATATARCRASSRSTSRNGDEPGLNGKAARDCTPEEIKTEVWEQLKRSVNYGDVATLRDEQLHSWSLDPSLRHEAAPSRTRNRCS